MKDHDLSEVSKVDESLSNQDMITLPSDLSDQLDEIEACLTVGNVKSAQMIYREISQDLLNTYQEDIRL